MTSCSAAIAVAGSDIHVLIDDGGHTMEQQQVSLGFLFKHVRPGGYYVIEDVHTSLPALWKGYGVEQGERNTTLRMLENFVRSPAAAIASKYMLPDETAYLNAHIESLNLSYRPAHAQYCGDSEERRARPRRCAGSGPRRRAGN